MSGIRPASLWSGARWHLALAVLVVMAGCWGDPFDPLNPFPPDSVSWQKAIGGSGDDVGMSVLVVDGGYAIIGYTNPSGADGFDMWLVKTDASGNVLWQKTYGGAGDQCAYSGLQAPDGGYVLAGTTASGGVLLVKTTADGEQVWLNDTYSGAYGQGCSVACESDGYLIAAYTAGSEANLYDLVLIKTNNLGAEQWRKKYPFDKTALGCCIHPVSGGGCVIAGPWYVTMVDSDDAFLVRTTADGTEVDPRRAYGGSDIDAASWVEPTADGGYILAGKTRSYGLGDFDAWLIKVDGSGEQKWSKTFGAGAKDLAECVREVAPGDGYIVAGTTRSYEGWDQAWLIRTDSSGIGQWTARIGGDNTSEYGHCVTPLSDGGFIMVGETKPVTAGDSDAYLVYYRRL